MPQLMPLNWCISFLMVSLFIIMMVFIYYNELKVNVNMLENCDNNIFYWKW